MKFGLKLLMVVGTMFSSIAYAGDATAIVQAVESKYATVEAMQADFTQTTHNEVFGDEVQKGVVVLKRPKMMFWDFNSGAKKQFITDGNTMWVYTVEDKQVIRYDNVGSGSSQADALLTSLDKLGELFNIELIEESVPGHSLALTPKTAGQVKALTLVLSETYEVQKVIITDTFDTVTDLEFSALKLDVVVDDATFTFTPPAGVEVITASGS